MGDEKLQLRVEIANAADHEMKRDEELECTGKRMQGRRTQRRLEKETGNPANEKAFH